MKFSLDTKIIEPENNIINNEPELLENIKIKNEQGKSYTITEFLDKIQKLKIVLD